MDNFSDKILFQTRQHIIVLFIKFLKLFFIIVIPIILLTYFLFTFSIILISIIVIISTFICFGYTYFFWSKSYFLISNKKISIKVRNGFFSKYHMSIYFKNIKDLAYSKNNIFQYIFNYGTLFARSSAGAVGDFEGSALPNIEKIYKYINNIYLLSEEKRDILDSLEYLEKGNKEGEKTENIEDIIKKEKNILLNIQGVKEVKILDNNDKSYLFKNEEDRNHGVYEILRKKIIFVITHDSTFRNPDEAIVLKMGEKTIFPTVKFHEIKRTGVISASPGLETHNYLKDKFENLADDDATILIGFDI